MLKYLAIINCGKTSPLALFPQQIATKLLSYDILTIIAWTKDAIWLQKPDYILEIKIKCSEAWLKFADWNHFGLYFLKKPQTNHF
jgi:hypothetical protein